MGAHPSSLKPLRQDPPFWRPTSESSWGWAPCQLLRQGPDPIRGSGGRPDHQEPRGAPHRLGTQPGPAFVPPSPGSYHPPWNMSAGGGGKLSLPEFLHPEAVSGRSSFFEPPPSWAAPIGTRLVVYHNNFFLHMTQSIAHFVNTFQHLRLFINNELRKNCILIRRQSCHRKPSRAEP